jgi:elongator complex protein 1
LRTLDCNDPPKLEEAFKIIENLCEEEIAILINDGGGGFDKSNISAEEAPKHLLCLLDLDVVFLATSGLHNLHLASVVSLNSQRDPKEFLPFLQDLEHVFSCYVLYYRLYAAQVWECSEKICCSRRFLF